MNEKKGKDTGSAEVIGGAALGLVAGAEYAVGVAVCPLCVIAAPILIGIGAAKKLKAKKSNSKKSNQ